MTINLTHRKATIEDISTIVHLYLENDELGQAGERLEQEIDQRYIDAFHRINDDPNQYLMVVESNSEIVGTCHLTLIPYLPLMGSTRVQIEAVRVAEKYRGKRIGDWMFNAAFTYAKSQGASLIQLTANKKRARAKKFYERLGFKASHEGMKLFLKDIRG